jgi:putative phosphoribosyl transferase
VIVAVPCASGEAARRFSAEADRLVSLIVDEAFYAVGAYYEDFSPVPDEAVMGMLAEARGIGSPSGEDPARVLVSFKNAHGRRLSGLLVLPPSGGPHPVAVFAHGWGSGKGSPRNRAVAEALLAAGFAALLFDFTGHGESEGSPDESTLGQQVEDLGAALDAVETFDDVDAGRIGVVGASSGAAVAIMRAATDARVRALVLRSPNPEGAEWAIPRVTAPTLLVVGEHDEPIRILNEELAVRFGGRCQMAVVPKGDHLFGDPWALDRAATLTVGWLRDHLG